MGLVRSCQMGESIVGKLLGATIWMEQILKPRYL